MNKTIVIVIAAVVLAAVMFGGGFLAAGQLGGSSDSNAVGMQGGPGGGFAQLSEAERQQLQNMSAEERQQFFKDKGIEMPQGFDPANGPGGAGANGAPGGMRGGTQLVEGTVDTVAPDKISVALPSGGSATFYVDDKTVKAAVSGAKPDVVQGAKVYVYAEPEAEGVTAARAIIVK